MNNKALSYIGLCKRAGRLAQGETACTESIKKKKSKLVIIASDASDNTKKKFKNSCNYYNIKYIVFLTKADLGAMLNREECAVISVEDDGFAKKITEFSNDDGGAVLG